MDRNLGQTLWVALAATALACGSEPATFAGAANQDVSAGGDGAAADTPADIGGTDSSATDSTTTDAGTCSVTTTSEPGVVATQRGLVRGKQDGNTMAWLGIPFAAPPVGELRLRDPQPHACWTGTRDALNFGAKCPQLDAKTGQPEGEEDCLTLNVFAPIGTFKKPLPVLVFIHGGGNVQGSASETILGGKPLYGGQHLAEKGPAVVVTVQYRLGPLGWLALPELTAEAGSKSGNYGLKDQLAALQWIQANIGAFGGDPKEVLVFGESAGAVDTCALVAAPAAKGLFRAALMESGACTQPKQEAAEVAHAARVAQGSCAKAADRLKCLRQLPTTKLLAELGGSIGIGETSFDPDPGKYGPLVDGGLLPLSPLDALKAGKANPVAFAVGCNSEELAKLLVVTVATEAELKAALANGFAMLGADAVTKIQAMYAATKYPTPQDALVAAYSDVRFVCPTRTIARAAFQGGNPSVWRYFFTRQAPSAKGPVAAAHGIELLYVFGSLADILGYKPAPADLTLSAAMMGYWTRLAGLGTPNGGDAPQWPAYATTGDPFLQFGDTVAAGAGVRAAECDLWAGLIPGY